MAELQKKQVRYLKTIVNDQITGKFKALSKTDESDLEKMQDEIESLYELRNQLAKMLTADGSGVTPVEQEDEDLKDNFVESVEKKASKKHKEVNVEDQFL